MTARGAASRQMIVRPYLPKDYPEWLRVRNALWPDQTEAEMAAWLASDALLANEVSHRAHERLSFTEVERVVLYRKDL